LRGWGDYGLWESMRSAGDERKAGRRLGELYAEHAAAVYAYAFHLLGTREEAEDVVQIAFMHAHRSLVRGEELVHPRAWLSTVVKRQAFNRWRDRRELPVEDPAPDRHAAEPGDAAEQLSQVRAVLFSLPGAQHQAFVLRHWSGLSTREIAQVLGTSESAAESLLVRARASILAAGPVAGDCVDIREKLAGGAELSGPQHRHVAGCSGCGRAQQRLTRVAAAAVVLGLVPHAHVAQALAAGVPGFAAAGAGGGAATGAGLAAKTAVAKVAASLMVSAVAVTAVAPLALHAAHRQHADPAARPAHARSLTSAAIAPAPAGGRGRFRLTADGTSGDATGPSTRGGGSGRDGGGSSSDGSSTRDGGSGRNGGGSSSDGSSSQGSGSSDGSGGSGSSSQTSSGDGTSQSGSDGSGSGDSGNVTSGGGSTSTDGGSTSGDSQGSTDGSGGQ
jgi:RNA polymerase sigma factor (sigma-70 family)